MPLFDFKCRSCGHEFEALVRPPSYGDPPLTCRACGHPELTQLLATFAVSSAGKTRAAAAAKNKKAAETGRAETLAMDREIEHHRKEDH